MKSSFVSISALIFLLLMYGCGSSPASNEITAKNAASGPNSNSNSSTSVVAPSANQQIAPGILGPVGNSNVDVNAPAAGNVDPNQRRRVIDVPTSGPLPTPIAVPAPDNSAVSTTMDRSGAFVETRVFKGDQYIAKVEKVSDGTKSTAKIYLKSGRVISVSPDNIGAINAVQLETLKQLAGIKSPTPLPQARGKEDGTTKKNQQQ